MTHPLRTLALAAVAAVLTCATASAQSHLDQATFTFKTDVMLSMTGYDLPPGEYSLERVGTTDVFQLHGGDVDAAREPIAMIDTWNTRTPSVAESTASPTEAVLKIVEPETGESARVLEGFTIQGEYFKIRDVVAVNDRLAKSS